MARYRLPRTPVLPAETAHWRKLHLEGWAYREIARAFLRSDSVVRYHLNPGQRQQQRDAQWCADHASLPKRKHHR